MSYHLVSLPSRYRILDALGGGGGGNVFKVEDRFLQRELALKLFDPSGGELIDEESFRTEFLLAASMSHPNLTRVFDYGHNGDNRPFFTMELVEGGEINSRNTLESSRRFLSFLGQICSALSLLHHFNYTHNDLKPSNIRFTWNDNEPVIKILDFGLTREYDPSHATNLSGTVEYMAPELFKSNPPSAQSDIYGIGVMLYELISGHCPYWDSDPLVVISGHVEGHLPPLEPNASFINNEAIRLITNMLEKQPSDRPQSAIEVYERFVSALGFNRDDLSMESISPYFESSVLQFIAKSQALTNAIRSYKDGFRLCCMDSLLPGFACDLAGQTLQTKFVNIRISSDVSDEMSFTSVHSPESIEIANIAVETVTSDTLPQSFIINLGNYGVPDARLNNIPALTGDSVLAASLKSLFAEDRISSNTEDSLLSLYGGNLELAKIVLTQLFERSILVRNEFGFTVDPDELGRFGYKQESIDIITEQIEFIGKQKREALGRLSIFGHRFTAEMASIVLERIVDDAGALLSDLSELRILEDSGGIFAFRHSSLQKVLYQRLDKRERERFHVSIAEFMANNEQFERVEQTGILSRHNLLGGNIKEGILSAVEHQKLHGDRGEFKEPEKMLVLCEEIYRSSDLCDHEIESKLLMSFGDMYKLQGETDKALEKYRKITELSDIEPRLMAQTYKNLGDIYKSRVEFSAGINALNRALEIFEQLGNQLEISHTLNNIGNIYWINSEYDLALEKYSEALRIQEKLGAVKDIASTLSNIGSTHFVKGAHSAAIEYFNRSIELKKKIDDQPEIARTYNNMAVAYLSMGEFGRSLNYLNRSMAINRRIGAQKEHMFNLENIAEVCMGLGEYRRAEEVSAEGLAMARRLEDAPHQGVFSMWLGTLYCDKGLYGKALEFLNNSMEVAEAIDDKLFRVKILLTRARTYTLLATPNLAKEDIESARNITLPIEIKNELVKLKILNAGIDLIFSDQPCTVMASLDQIDEEIEKHKLRQELCESLLLRLEAATRLNRIPADVLEKLDKLTEIDQHTVYRSFLYFYLGVASVADKLYNEALSYFDQAEVMAQAFEQRELLWRINFHVGKIHIAQLEYEEAFLRLRIAGNLLKEIAANISDQTLAISYMKGREKLELLDAVKHLAVKLA